MRYRLVLCLLFVATGLFGMDEIHFHSGEMYKGKVQEIADGYVWFKHDGEDHIEKIAMNWAVDKIIFESGRTKDLPEPPKLTHWKDVVVTYEPIDVERLEKTGELKTKSGWERNLGIKKTIRHLQKKAFQKKAFIVLIIKQSEDLAKFVSSTGHFYRIPEK